MYEIGGHCLKPIVLTLSPPIIHSDVFALDVTDLIEAVNESGHVGAYPSGVPPLRNPTTGIFGCCARAPIGHVAAAEPRSVMNCRMCFSEQALSNA
jgi:hypothetical protein